MLKFRRPVLSILSAILICASLMVSFPVLDTLINPEGASSGTSEVLADESVCGDGDCDEKSENCCNCPADCGCGDGLCLSDEGGCWCGYCGDSQCTVYGFKPCSYEKNENCHNCPADCGCSGGFTCVSDEGGCWMCGCIDGVMVLDGGGHVICRPKKDDGTGSTGAAVCGDGACETDKGESCANCLSDCPCSSGEACQTSDSNADPWGCVVVAVPKGMALTVNTDKKTYSPEEMVIVSGSVRDAKSGEPISGANVAIDINPKASTTTDLSGNYKEEVPLPPDISQGTHTVTVTASKTEYAAVTKTTSFSVVQALIVEISTDKMKCESLFSLVGEEIYCTITVKDAATGKLVPYADLKIITTHLCTRKGTRKVTELSGATDGIGESTWSFTLEERLKIEVTASRDGYSDGHKSIIYPEDCFWSPEVCKGIPEFKTSRKRGIV